jgi:DNA-binding HxlR family transcriptional regulator
MTKGYGQYCPLALAMELLGERWTILVVSRLLDGCRRFNEIHRGVPRISASLLSRRLAQLQDAGLCEKRALDGRLGYEYVPTAACRELDPIVMQLAAWGQRWARDMEPDDLDPAFLAWSMSTRLDTGSMPPGRTVIEFEFSGLPGGYRRLWLVNDDGKIDMCLKHPGFEVDVRVVADVRRFVEAWRGFRSLRKEIAGGHIRLEGPPASRRALPKWLLGSALANESRQRPGIERDVFAQAGDRSQRRRSSP